ncbi:Orotidine 5'-phosphate decarboxylase [Liberibacter crescens BT-1]|uniref:Orotidine 5'-phosphate decarboxylase n=1 Tax=Liberibacter crescens (strain BT-1) TaxID=1215343 RepID=L0ERK0_LIBCB|nr:orotidine-5'-phosphate decarboxylase [Liberibacter crescens]AGA64109.1 Orotidine 5'-phosphate decarboxylase [Liberibacter crescens BT-1]AMC12390.1 orotidine 5'-phosphate decarboxylase [Liberibacter crescens]
MKKTNLDETSCLIVGLDLPTVLEAEKIVALLGDTVNFYKIGYHLVFSGGLELARDLIYQGKNIFLDLKLLDIDNTVAGSVENIAKMGITMLTLHAYPRVMKSAVAAARGSEICLLAVTVLTSMDDNDLIETGYRDNLHSLVIKRAVQAYEFGMGGVVCSAREAAVVRSKIGKEMSIVTPGIRIAGTNTDDQKRSMSPKAALEAGASHIVIARPIVRSADPLLETKMFLEEIKSFASQAI